MNRGQSVIEYVLLVAISVIALVVGGNFFSGLKGGAFETHFQSARYRINNPGSAIGTPVPEPTPTPTPEPTPTPTPPPGQLPDVPPGEYTGTFHTYFYGLMEQQNPVPGVEEVSGIAHYGLNNICYGGCPSLPQGYECRSSCLTYCGRLCAILPSEEYKQACASGCS